MVKYIWLYDVNSIYFINFSYIPVVSLDNCPGLSRPWMLSVFGVNGAAEQLNPFLIDSCFELYTFI